MQYKKIHFVGIKGVGMTPLALIAKEAGIEVTGSDVGDEFITDPILRKAGIEVSVGFLREHITDQDLVITTGAHGGYDNIEVKEAKERGLPLLTQGQAVGEFMKGELFGREQIGISVAGSHGKTTTTALISTVLMSAEKDPSFVIGTSDLFPLGNPGHFGKGEVFIAEADEYATEPVYDKTAKFLWQHPSVLVITNIELDHPDIYPDLAAVKRVFLQFALQLPSTGLLIACGDDEAVQDILKEYTGVVQTYGFSESNMFVIKGVTVSPEGTSFEIWSKGVLLETFMVGVFGEHNALNATACYLAAKHVGVVSSEVREGLLSFKGTKRRLEYIGKLTTGALLYDDYAHHPTEIQNTLKTLKSMYPEKKLLCFFQPHTYSRTKKLFEDFSDSFEHMDLAGIISIYPSAREEIDLSITSEMLVTEINKKSGNAKFFSTPSDVVQYLQNLAPQDDTVVITMGAGDLYKIKETLYLS